MPCAGKQMMNTIIVPRDIRQLPKVLPPPSYDAAPRPAASDLQSPKDQVAAAPLSRPPSRGNSPTPSSKGTPVPPQPAAGIAIRNGYRLPSSPSAVPVPPRAAAPPAYSRGCSPSVIAPPTGVPGRSAAGTPQPQAGIPVKRLNSAEPLAPGVRPGPRRISCS